MLNKMFSIYCDSLIEAEWFQNLSEKFKDSKIIKIKEFVNNLDINSQIEKENLKDALINYIKEKKGKNKINYDEIKGKILSISNLIFDNNKYILI